MRVRNHRVFEVSSVPGVAEPDGLEQVLVLADAVQAQPDEAVCAGVFADAAERFWLRAPGRNPDDFFVQVIDRSMLI